MSVGAENSSANERRMRVFSYSTQSRENLVLLNKYVNQFIPRRFIFSFVAFVAGSLAVSFNMNISIAIVSMIDRNDTRNNSSINSQAKQFNWSAQEQSIAVASVYYGQLISLMPGGRMAELFGGKKMLIIFMMLSTLFTAVSPIAANIGVYAFAVARFFVGLGTGPIIPIIFFMLSQWIPFAERSMHASIIISGYGVGSFLAVIISGALCGSDLFGGWPSVFYAGGAFGTIWCILAYFLMYESPEHDPRISHAEILYIESGLMKNKTKIKNIPWKQMVLSVPLWALAFGFFGQFWLLGFFSTAHAIYMGTVLELPITQNGELSCLPHLLRAITTCLASYPVDLLLQKKKVSVSFVRKMATVINTVVSCAAFLGITLVGKDTLATTLLFIAGGILGEFVTFGVCMACIDIAPNLSGTVSGIINIVGVFPFFIVPFLVGWLTNYEKSFEKWKYVFYSTIVITSLSTLIFVIFGDLKPQSWGSAPEEEEMEEKEKDKKSVNGINGTYVSYNT